MEEVQYFWAGTLQVNDLGEHSLFHIKDRKVSTDYPVELELSTDDLPPAPVRKGDVLRVALYLESNVGTQTVRYKIVDGSFFGYLLEGKEAPARSARLSVAVDNTEWDFVRQHDEFWLLIGVKLRVPAAQVRRFVSV